MVGQCTNFSQKIQIDYYFLILVSNSKLSILPRQREKIGSLLGSLNYHNESRAIFFPRFQNKDFQNSPTFLESHLEKKIKMASFFLLPLIFFQKCLFSTLFSSHNEAFKINKKILNCVVEILSYLMMYFLLDSVNILLITFFSCFCTKIQKN